MACTSDENCGGIYDRGCTALRWGYALCPRGYKEEISTISCLYVKFGRCTLDIASNNCPIFSVNYS